MTGRPSPPLQSPLAGVLVVEGGLAAALALGALHPWLWPVGGLVLALALVVGLLRWRGEGLVEWVGVGLRYRCRVRDRAAEADAAGDDGRLARLRLVAGDLALTTGTHRGAGGALPVGLLGLDGVWSAALAPRDAAAWAVGDPDDAPAFPLAALAAELEDRGVVLDAITAVWHTVPAPADSAAAAAYREVVGPWPAVRRRDALLVVRLDPARCPDAVAARGGPGIGTRRALLGALARVHRALADAGVRSTPLDADELLDAALATGLDGLGASPTATEHWAAVVTAGDDAEVGHTTWALTPPAVPGTLAALADTGVATTVSAALVPGDGGPALHVGLRQSAASPDDLASAAERLTGTADRLGTTVRRLDGRHAHGLAATLPVPAAPTARDRGGSPRGPALLPAHPVGPDDLVDPGPGLTPSAVLLGTDPAGRPVTVTLWDVAPLRVVVLGAFSLARTLALRASALGAGVRVDTGRPAAWAAVARAGGLDDAGAPRVDLAPRPGPDGVAGPVIHVHDRGAVGRGAPLPDASGHTELLVLPSLTPAVAELADEADLVLLTRMPPAEAEYAGRLWRLDPGMVETLRTLPDHGTVALGPDLWRRVDRVTGPSEARILDG